MGNSPRKARKGTKPPSTRVGLVVAMTTTTSAFEQNEAMDNADRDDAYTFIAPTFNLGYEAF
jgi:hypothetical protein